MEKKKLSLSFGNSLKINTESLFTNIMEVGIDSFLDDGVLKDVPFLSTVMGVYKVGTSIRERFHFKKLLVFIEGLNKNINNEDELKNYQMKFRDNSKFRSEELEYIVVIIDKFLSLEKSVMLSRLYLAYLDNEIIWDEFLVYSEVVDRLFKYDCDRLFMSDINNLLDGKGVEAFMRLSALGLTRETMRRANSPDRTFEITEFGKKFKKIVNRNF